MSLIVANELHAFLVAEGIGQLPEADPSTTVPSIWLQPREGAPLPRQGEEVTVTINDPHLQARPNLEAWIEEAYVDITIRGRHEAAAKLLHRTIRGLLEPIGIVGGRKNWMMNDLRVLYSKSWRSEQPLPPTDGGITYDRVASYQIGCARSDLS